jgi:hypothetical protein
MSYSLTNTIDPVVVLHYNSGIHASEDLRIMTSANPGTNIVYVSTNSGATFTSSLTEFSGVYQAPSISSDGSFIFTQNRTNIYVSTNVGKTWTSVLGGLADAAFVKCSSTGQYVVTSSNSSARAYVSSNYGKTWNFVTVLNSIWQGMFVSRSGQYMLLYGNSGISLSSNFGVSFTTMTGLPTNYVYSAVCSEDGKLLTASFNSARIFASSNSGATWTLVLTSSGLYHSLSCSSNGLHVIGTPIFGSGSGFFTKNQFKTIQFLSGLGNSGGNWMSSDGLYGLRYDNGNNRISIYTYPFPIVTINGTIVAYDTTYTAIARTKSVNVVATPRVGLSVLSITGGTDLNEDLNTVTITMDDNSVFKYYVMVLRNCFKEDTKILCYVDNKEQYIPVQELRKGTLVKTQVNGYVPVQIIGHSKIYNSANKLRSMNRLFKCTKENYSEITEDLIITGCHGILVEEEMITEEVRKKTKEITRDDKWLTGKKYRLLTCLDERAQPYEEEGVFNIWHFALDHFDRFMNYGVYANGLLVETCDIYNMEEHSGLELIE